MRDKCVAILIVTAFETCVALKRVIELFVVWLDVVIIFICNTPSQMAYTCGFHWHIQLVMIGAHKHISKRATSAR
jgi:hypothetical protein